MTISVQFKDKNKNFKGKSYDFLLHQQEELPHNGDIIRLMDSNFKPLYYGTRVKVTNIRNTTPKDSNSLSTVRYLKTTLDD